MQSGGMLTRWQRLADMPASAYKQAPSQTSREHRMATYKVGYFVGSLSTTSINRTLSKALVRLAPPSWS